MQLVSAAIAMLERNHARAYLQPLPKPEWRQIIVARDLEVGKKLESLYILMCMAFNKRKVGL